MNALAMADAIGTLTHPGAVTLSEADDSRETAQTQRMELELFGRAADPKHAEDYNRADWLNVPLDSTDWMDVSGVIGYLRLKANDAARKLDLERAENLNSLADRLTRTRKKIQARVAAGGGR